MKKIAFIVMGLFFIGAIAANKAFAFSIIKPAPSRDLPGVQSAAGKLSNTDQISRALKSRICVADLFDAVRPQ